MSQLEHSDAFFENQEFAGDELAHHHFENCTFRRCRFVTSRLLSTRFVGCRFESCDFSLARLLGTTLRDSVLSDCKAVGVNWTEASGIHGTQFLNCKLSDGIFAGLDLRHIRFDGSLLENADFEGTRLDKASLRETRLGGARFQKTSLVETDLAHAEGYAFDPRANRLRNTKVTVPEALVILEVLGMKIV